MSTTMAISWMLTLSPNILENRGDARKREHDGTNKDCCCRTCAPIQALVLGLAPRRRLARLLAMVRYAYIDESGRGQTAGAYVAAGFVAPEENWLPFAADWQTVLDGPPKLAYFKTKEAMGMGGPPFEQFRGWTREQADERVDQFLELIHQHKLLPCRVFIPHRHYKQIFKGKVNRRFDNPFFVPTYSIIQVTLRYLAYQGITDKVEFVFDKTTNREKKLIRRAWDLFTEYAARETKPLWGNEPSFRDDKEVLPLQVADLHAWHAREFALARSHGDEYDHPVWKSICSVSAAEREWDATDLRGVYDMIPRSRAQWSGMIRHLKRGS